MPDENTNATAVAKPKRGRPKQANNKDVRINVRIDAQLKKMLDVYCAILNINESAAIRLALESLVNQAK